MNYSDEQLMAYVDGQCDADECAAIETAAAHDPQLAARLDQQRAQRRGLLASLSTAFDPILSEPVPQRLLDTLQPKHTDNVVPLKPRTPHATAAPSGQEDRVVDNHADKQWSKTWIAMAASLVVGILLGTYALQPGQQSIPQTTAWFGMQQKVLVTQGALSTALNEQLASNPTVDAPVHMAVSFRDQTGHYCRTFVLSDQQLAGLACHVDAQWQVRVLSATNNPATSGDSLRQAGTALPAAVLNAMDSQIQGEALDATAEQQARQAGWH